MGKEQTVILNCTQAETEYRLKQQLRFRLPHGHVEADTFTLYKRVSYGKDLFLFRFSGSYQQVGTQTIVYYRVGYAIGEILILLFIFLFLMLSIYTAVGNRILWPAVVGILVNVLYLMLILSQRKECIRRFLTQLTSPIFQTQEAPQ